MKSSARIIGLGIAMLGGVVPAYASAGGTGSGVVLISWLFIGFFALVVLGQLVPAVVMLLGMARGIAGSEKASEEIPVIAGEKIPR